MSGPRRYTRPPIAGPAIVETCQALEFTATAREKSAEGTRFGMIAWPAGIENARAMPNTTITPNTGQATVRPDIVNPRSASAQKNSSAMQSARIAARLWRSATWPAGSTSSTNGRNCERPMRPRSSGLPVIAYTCQPTATVCICTAIDASSRADRKRMKPECESSRPRGAPVPSRSAMRPRSVPDQEPQHSAQRFGRAPQQLVADRERRDVILAHREMPDAAHRDCERAGDGRGREGGGRRLALVRHDPDPLVRARDCALDLHDFHRPLQLDRHRLAVAAHRADAHAYSIDRHGCRLRAEDLVALRARLEFLAAVAVTEVAVDPWKKASRERLAKARDRHAVREGGRGAPVDVEDRARGIVEQLAGRIAQVAHLHERLAHLARTRAGCRLVGHRGHPLDETRAEEPAKGHQHEAHGAVAANPVPAARGERDVDERAIDRVEDDDRIVLQAKLRGRVDPVAAPAARTQLRVHGFGVVAALAGNEYLAARERIDVVCIAD